MHMNTGDAPVYVSLPAKRSLENRYAIYADRIELLCRLPFVTKTLVIKRDELVSIETYKPPVIRTSLFALKLDLADLFEHVGLVRKNGLFKQLRFTPKNPREFVEKVKELWDIA